MVWIHYLHSFDSSNLISRLSILNPVLATTTIITATTLVNLRNLNSNKLAINNLSFSLQSQHLLLTQLRSLIIVLLS